MSLPPPSLFDLRSGVIDAVHLVVKTADFDALRAALLQRLDHNPEFFDGEALAIDLRRLPDGATLPLDDLAAVLRELRMRPLGVVANEAQRGWAQTSGLPLLASREPYKASARAATAESAAAAGCETPDDKPGGTAPSTPTAPGAGTASQTAAVPAAQTAGSAAALATPEAFAPAWPTAASATVVIDRPLRSGQRAYSRGDLVVYGMVSHGAEVMAEGHVHVYGALRGRALAGARGNTEARIFCTSFDPELVAIAGIYRTAEQELPAGIKGQPALVRLEQEQLRIEPLALR